MNWFLGISIFIGYIITLVTMVVMQGVTNTIATTSMFSLIFSALIINFVSVWFVNEFTKEGFGWLFNTMFTFIILYISWDSYVLIHFTNAMESIYDFGLNVMGLQVVNYTQVLKIMLPSLLYYFIKLVMLAWEIAVEKTHQNRDSQ